MHKRTTFLPLIHSIYLCGGVSVSEDCIPHTDVNILEKT